MTDSILNLFYRLPQNIWKIFSGKNLLWHLLAIIVTVAIVVPGFDWWYFKSTQNVIFSRLMFPGVFLGLFVPILVPLFLLIVGTVQKNSKLLNSGFASAQASALGWLVSVFYKVFTGRPGPVGSMVDISKVFHFGFFRGGIFWGWPSSHTTVAFAFGLSLFMLNSKNKFVKFLSLVYAIYVGIAVSMTIHWFSDFVAGVIFGSIVGITVGKSFLNRAVA